MYPAPFEYARVSSWQEAVDLLAHQGEDAKVIAGGQSLVPMMSLRLLKPRFIIDVNDLDDGGIRLTDGTVVIGALTRHAELERSDVLERSVPLLREAAALIGNVRVRHRGTIGGSLAHADPAAELPCVAVAAGAQIRALGPSGERRLPAESMFVSYFTTALEPTELIVSVEFPPLPPRRGSAFVELARRAGDFATAAAAAIGELDDEGRCTDIRLVFTAVADRPVDVSEAARELVGERVNATTAARASQNVTESIEPRNDERASAAYRQEMVRVLAARAVMAATDRALQTEGG
jgi:aerobic carbon-monoxide dehydrogenase medium subunit